MYVSASSTIEVCSRWSSSSVGTQLVRPPLFSLFLPELTTASLLGSSGYFGVVTFVLPWLLVFLEVLGEVHPHHPSRPPGGRGGWPWRFALDGALAFLFTSRRYVVAMNHFYHQILKIQSWDTYRPSEGLRQEKLFQPPLNCEKLKSVSCASLLSHWQNQNLEINPIYIVVLCFPPDNSV